jgi:6-phosphofructokinase 1
VAQCFLGNDCDNRSLPGIKIDVCMGRNAGWLTAASALARRVPGDGPHLIYVPERPVTVKKFCEDVEAVYQKYGRALVAVSEGMAHTDGKTYLESATIREELVAIGMPNLADNSRSAPNRMPSDTFSFRARARWRISSPTP